MSPPTSRAGAKKKTKAQLEKETAELAALLAVETVCPDCNAEVLDSEKGILCETCRTWYHATCQDIEDDTLAYLEKDAKKNNCLGFFCQGCSRGVRTVYAQVCALSRRQSDLEEKVDVVSKNVQALDVKVDKNETDQSSIITELKKDVLSLQEEMKTLKGATSSDVDKDVIVKEAVSQAVEEVENRKVRERNFIIHGIPMSTSADGATRKEHDTNKVKELLVKAKVSAKFFSCRRLGKVVGTKNLPIRITAADDESYSNIQKAAKIINALDTGNLKLVNIRPDKTPFQRDEMRFLVLEKNDKQKSSLEKGEDAEWVIRRPRNGGRRRVMNITSQARKDRAEQDTGTISAGED